MSLLQNASAQYIDQSGKTRALIYKDLALFISPIAPLALRSISLKELQLLHVNVKRALSFIKENKLEILYQQGYEKSKIIFGLWIDTKNIDYIYEAYIPISTSDRPNEISGITFSGPESVIRLDQPLVTVEESNLSSYLDKEKTALYLKEYSIFEWACDKENFGIESYTFDDNYAYDEVFNLKGKLIRYTSEIYRDGKLVVPDRETAERLIYYVQVRAYNDPFLEAEYSKKTKIDGGLLYGKLSDFKVNPNQILFAGKRALKDWMNNRTEQHEVFSVAMPEMTNPYFYRNMKVEDGRIVLIQNINQGVLRSALSVARDWHYSSCNTGYFTAAGEEELEKEIDYTLYSQRGLEHSGGVIKIFQYKNGKYAAILTTSE